MKKMVSLTLAAAMLLAALAGCGNTKPASTAVSATESVAVSESAVETAVPTASAASAPASSVEEVSAVETEASAAETAQPVSDYTFPGTYAAYPLCEEGTETLSLWCEFPGFLSMIGIDSYNDFTTFAAAQKATGVKVEFTEVSMTTAAEQFSLMAAAQDYMDLINGVTNMYGSSSAAIEDEIIIDLKDYAQQYMGNYMTILNDPANIVAKETAYNSEGQLPAINSIADGYCPTTGAQIRQDWLDALNLDTPKTYDDWENVLLAFRENYNCSAPLLLAGSTQGTNGMLVGGYGTIGASEVSMGAATLNMYVVDGQVRNGYEDASYQEYIKMLAKWYGEGLLSPDFLTTSGDNVENNTDGLIVGGNAGIWYSQGNFLDTYTAMAQSTDPNFKAVGLAEPYNPAYTDGINHFGTDAGVDASSASISVSTACENVELACDYLDYFFTEDGQILCNYGIEGEAFTYDDKGEPQYTDLLVKSNNFQFYLVGYTMSAMPTYQVFDRQWFSYSDTVIKAFDTWGACTDSTQSIPSALTLNTEQADEYASIFSDIQTLAEEYIGKFIIGEYDVDAQWGEFVTTIQGMNLARCVEIYQEAYDQFQAREI